MAVKKDVPELEENDSEFAAVFSDLMSFLTGFFILLFTIANATKSNSDLLTKMNVKFGAKKVEQEKVLTTEELLVSDVKNFIQEERLSQYILVLVDEQKIRLVLNDPILFESGTDNLKERSKAVLNGLIHFIQKVKNPMIIEGHTDDIPVKSGGKYRSNWDLAYYRASAVAGYFINQGIDQSRLAISSFGDQRPLARSKTYLARKKNRRIEINIIRVKEK